MTVAQMIDFVKRRLLMEDRPISLRRLLHNTQSERALICTFLAMLELVRLQAILLRQPAQFGRHPGQEDGRTSSRSSRTRPRCGTTGARLLVRQ